MEANTAFYKQTLVATQPTTIPAAPALAIRTSYLPKEWLTATTEKELWALVLHQFKKAGFDELHAITQARCARILRVGEFD